MKKPLLTLVLALMVNYMYSQTTCATAYNFGTINGDATTQTQSGSLYTVAATNTTGSSCGNRPSLYYKVVIPASSTTLSIKVTRTGNSVLADNTTFIEVFNNTTTCAGITGSMGCNDISTLRTYTIVAGGTYYFRVNTSQAVNGSSTGYNFTVSVFSNDNPCTATPLTPGVPFFLSTVSSASATASITGPACTGGNPNDDVWFSFVPGASSITLGLFNIATGTNSLASSGTRVEVYNGTCAAPTAIAGACGSSGAANFSMNLTGLSTSTTYYIRVFSAGATALTAALGQFSIFVTPLKPAVFGSGRMYEVYQQQNLTGPNMLDDPWEVTYGDDGVLWVTEAKGYKVHRINPTTGVDQVVLDLSNASSFTPSSFRKTWTGGGPQGGMMGLALHPDFATNVDSQFVYLAYVHDYVGNSPTLPTGEKIIGDFYRTWIVKFTWNGTSLGSPEIMTDTLRGSNDHNSGRMIIAPYGNRSYVFYACGDQGGGQFGNIARPNKAQNVYSTEGKILRFNLTNDGEAGLNGFVPNDNPYNYTGYQSPVWSIGIRNNQGFAKANVWGREILYGESHGPFTDDELNIIDRRKNYGHPVVIGYATDGNYDGARAGQIQWNVPPMTSSIFPVISSEIFDRDSINTSNPDSYRDPIYTFYPAPKGNTGTVNSVQWLYNDISSAYVNNGSWPSEGTSGIDFYKWSAIPGWKNSMLIATLKNGRVLRLRLNQLGLGPVSTGGTDTISYFGSTNRYRDVAFSPGGKDLFVIMEKSGSSSGPSASNPIVPACAGCLQKYTFLGYAANAGAANRSYIPNFIDVAQGKSPGLDTANKIVINAAKGNTNVWVPITDTNSNIIAEINARGHDLDTVTTWLYTRTGTSRIKNGVKYLNRNITISPQKQPGASIWVRFYITKAEYNQLVADGGLGSIGAIKLLKNNDSCTTTLSTTSSATAITNFGELFKTDATPGVGPIDSTSYVIQGDISEFNSAGGSAKSASFYFAGALVILPVELLTFKGELQNNATLLQWKTTREVNTSYFDVERSTDGINFSSMGTVRAQGNTNNESDYSLVDNDVTTLPVKIVYYRLKIMDNNGEFKYSNVVSVSLASLNGSLAIAPNPVKHDAIVNVMAPLAGKMQWNITDNAGRIVLQSSTEVSKGRNVFTVDMSKLAAGIYYFNVNGAGLDQNIKVQKQ